MNRLQRFFQNDRLLSSVVTLSVRYMSKFLSKSATKRLPLTTKRVRKGYYKGNGATKEGHLTSKGRFIHNPLKRLQLVIPDLEGFKLKPYVALAVSEQPPESRPEHQRRLPSSSST